MKQLVSSSVHPLTYGEEVSLDDTRRIDYEQDRPVTALAKDDSILKNIVIKDAKTDKVLVAHQVGTDDAHRTRNDLQGLAGQKTAGPLKHGLAGVFRAKTSQRQERRPGREVFRSVGGQKTLL